MTYLILILALLFNVFQASLEAYFNHLDNINPNKNKIHRFIEKYHIGVVILFFILWAAIVYFLIPNDIPYWKLFFGYWFVRFLIYDTIWNVTSILLGNNVYLWGYGTTKRYDRIMTKLGSWGWFVKGVLGIVGIVFLLGVQEYINK